MFAIKWSLFKGGRYRQISNLLLMLPLVLMRSLVVGDVGLSNPSSSVAGDSDLRLLRRRILDFEKLEKLF